MRQKKNFGLGSLEADGGRWGGRTPSGTIRGRRLGQKEPFEPKKNFDLGRPLSASGGRPGGRPTNLAKQLVSNFT